MRKNEMSLTASAVAGNSVYKRIDAVGHEQKAEYSVCSEHYDSKHENVKE
jgi:hypothetical protein